MPLDRGNIKPGARLKTRWITDLYDLLNGTITDTDVTFGRNLIVKGSLSTVGSSSQVAPGPSDVTLTLYGVAGQTADIFQVRDYLGNLLFAIQADGELGPVRIPDFTLAQHNHTSPTTGGTLTISTSLEVIYASSTAVVSVNYVVTEAISFVFVTAGVVVTLPAAATSNRPIWIVAVAGPVTVNATGGSVVGGSINQGSGAIMNGTITAGDAITYKSDGSNWRAV